MSTDDIIYFICLMSCILFGGYYRKIENDSQRKLIGTGLGVLIVFIVSGLHVLHTLLSSAICILIITKLHPRQCHLISFGFMFSYLAFFRTTEYFGIPYPPGLTNMIQMLLTLKLVGIAFEKNAAYNKLSESDPTKKLEVTEIENYLLQIDANEIFHYAFNYIGILTGPYYRYRTYRDYFETPFRNHAKCLPATIEKILQIAVYIVVYLIANYFWPLNYAMETEFYEKRSFIYRLMYLWPTFLIFRMRIYSGLLLGEAVCTSAGFGAYPNEADTASGEGPRKSYLQLKRYTEWDTYNFNTIKNIDVLGVETCWTFREAMRYWNICVQYWLAINVYKRFPSKRYRMIAILLVSSFWHGIYSGYYLCIMGATIYTPLEDMYHKLFRKDATGTRRQIIDAIFWISKFFSLGYLGIAFFLMTIEKIWFYYNSVYHFGYVCWAILFGVGMVLISMRGEKDHHRKKHGEQSAADSSVTSKE